MSRRLELLALAGLPEIGAGADLPRLLADAAMAEAGGVQAGDIVVLAQKIVSKAEDRFVVLDEVVPGPRALRVAAECQKDPRLVEVILGEATDIVRHRPGVLIVRHRLGLVLANAGMDASNVPRDSQGRERVLLLPVDPDGSARRIRDGLAALTGVAPGVLINDSPGRAWRVGSVGIAIGLAGLPSWTDLRGTIDRDGRPMQSSELGVADELAAAASILMGQAAEGVPAVIIRGLALSGDGAATDMVRHPRMDLFR